MGGRRLRLLPESAVADLAGRLQPLGRRGGGDGPGDVAEQGLARRPEWSKYRRTTRGGAYGPGTPREGWDHSSAYLRRILVDVWGAGLIVVEREFTLPATPPERTHGQIPVLPKRMASPVSRYSYIT